jgi:two-component system sensor histidine kinase UhpB
MADSTPTPSKHPLFSVVDGNRWMVDVSRGDLFAMPVLYRVLIANCIVLVVGALLGTALLTETRGDNRSSVFVGFIIIGLLVSVVVNFVLLKIAFDPLTRLRDTMRKVEAGDMTLRAPISGFDPDADELAATFNHMVGRLDEISRSRAAQIMRAQEEERKRIARELHDETSQVLTSLLVSLAVVDETVTDPTTQERITQAREMAHRTLRAIRDLSIELRPSALDDLGLLPALSGYVKDYQQKFGIIVDLQVQGLKERYAMEIETALYRIVQESLTNIAKHAEAQHVWISLHEQNHEAHVHITDDGKGFDPDQPLHNPSPTEGGLGLMGMRERAALFDGHVMITSQPGKGTSVDVIIPLSEH